MSLLFKFPYWEILKRCRRLSSKANFPESQHTDNWAPASLPAKLLALQNTTKPNRPALCFLYFARLLLLIFSYILPVFCFLYFAFYILFKNRYLKYNQLKPRQSSPVQSYIFSCPEQLNRWPCHSLTHSLTQSVTDWGYFYFWDTKSDPRDLWPLIHLIRVMRDHDLTTKIQWQWQRQSQRLVTFETLITILTVENLNSWHSLLPDN